MKTRQDVFKALRDFFNDRNISSCEQEAVWDVLTALRGPDDQSGVDKRATTEVIRWTLFGDGSTVCGMGNMAPDYEGTRDHRKNMQFNHFEVHAQEAFVALGLNWDKVNE